MKRMYYWSFIVLLAFYIVLTFSLPPDPQVISRYQLTPADLRLLNLSIVIPITAIYLSALFGFLRVKDYSHNIHKTKEGPYFKDLANGLMVLAFSLPVNSIIGALFSYSRYRHQNLLPALTILRGYTTLALAGTAIYLISKGAQGLYDSLKQKEKLLNPTLALAGPILISSFFTWLITAQEVTTNSQKTYYLPQWLIILSIAIPYTLIWCMGVKAAFQLYRYKSGVKGSVYKQIFDNLSKGVGVIIVVSILIQFITTLSEQLSRLNLSPLLLIIYLLIILYAIGFGLVARGSKKLKMIEEA